MTPDEIIEQLKKMGVEISRPTLSRYEKQELIPKPQRGGLGRGGGRWTDYPENTVEQAYAAWSMMHGSYGSKYINREFFDNKPPKINPSTIKSIRVWDMLKTGLKKVVEDEEKGIIDPVRADFMAELEKEREKTKDMPVPDREPLPEWARIYDEMAEPLKNFLTLVWLYEIEQAKKKLDAIK